MMGLELQQICFGLWQLQLHFAGTFALRGNSLTIAVGNELEHFSNGTVKKWHWESGRSSLSLNELLELKITNALVDAKDSLHIKFENGDAVKINCAHNGLESYTVTYNNNYFIIGPVFL